MDLSVNSMPTIHVFLRLQLRIMKTQDLKFQILKQSLINLLSCFYSIGEWKIVYCLALSHLSRFEFSSSRIISSSNEISHQKSLTSWLDPLESVNQIILVKFTQQLMIISLGCDERKMMILAIETQKFCLFICPMLLIKLFTICSTIWRILWLKNEAR